MPVLLCAVSATLDRIVREAYPCSQFSPAILPQQRNGGHRKLRYTSYGAFCEGN